MHLTLGSKLTLFPEYHENGALNHFNTCGWKKTAPFLLLNKYTNIIYFGIFAFILIMEKL